MNGENKFVVLVEIVGSGTQLEYRTFPTRKSAREYIESNPDAKEEFCWVVQILDEYVPPIEEKPAKWYRYR